MDMSLCETDDGFRWIVQYKDHRSGRCDVGATINKSAAEIVPVVKRIMASTLIPNIIQTDNGVFSEKISREYTGDLLHYLLRGLF